MSLAYPFAVPTGASLPLVVVTSTPEPPRGEAPNDGCIWNAVQYVFEEINLGVEVACECPLRLVAAGHAELDLIHSGRRAAQFVDRARTIVAQAAAALIASITGEDIEQWTGVRYELMSADEWASHKRTIAGQTRCRLESLFRRRKYEGLFDAAHPCRVGTEQRTIYPRKVRSAARDAEPSCEAAISAEVNRLAPRTYPLHERGMRDLDELICGVELPTPELPPGLTAAAAAVAIKYIFSSGVSWELQVRATAPLWIHLEPNRRMQDILLAVHREEDRERARTVVARSLNAMVFNLTEQNLQDAGILQGPVSDSDSSNWSPTLAGLRPFLRAELERVLREFGTDALLCLARRDSVSAGTASELHAS